jgi:hypothetical protein
MLAADGAPALVVDDGNELGVVSVEAIAGLLAEETGA